MGLPAAVPIGSATMWARADRGLVTMKRIMVFGLLAAILWTAENWWLNARQADVSVAPQKAVVQVERKTPEGVLAAITVCRV